MPFFKPPNFAIIAAASENWGIGINNGLPWKLKLDMKYFEQTTKRVLPSNSADNEIQNALIMGRNTWESIPPKFQPLKNRLNIVISKSLKETKGADHVIYPSLDEAITNLMDSSSELSSKVSRIFIIGGAQIYKETINSPYCSYILLTRVYKHFECDTFFPEIDEQIFSLASHEELEEVVGEKVQKGCQTENGIEFEFLLYKRRI
ncbi:dihydrofolate reductase-like domain-containing protein [Glomus cerebriforme]|uniref:Dihydrofolate reductase n=1 Tax=Glomus cerebriforme TaxID=658196 RepID=A0A397SU78_9GLOM|nr:dihydrofolate reductase-like domain-containing protein [Glomus cerebriforme]